MSKAGKSFCEGHWLGASDLLVSNYEAYLCSKIDICLASISKLRKRSKSQKSFTLHFSLVTNHDWFIIGPKLRFYVLDFMLLDFMLF